MYTLEIETKNKIIKVNNPKKAKVKDFIIFDALQLMDENGKWRTICYVSTEPRSKTEYAVDTLNSAVKKNKSTVYIDF